MVRISDVLMQAFLPLSATIIGGVGENSFAASFVTEGTVVVTFTPVLHLNVVFRTLSVEIIPFVVSI